MDSKINLREQLPAILRSKIKPVVTACILHELKQLGDDFRGASLAAKRTDTKRCGHKTPLAPNECIKSLVGKDNPEKIVTATQDIELRKELRRLGCAPLIFVTHNSLFLERPSKEGLDFAKSSTSRRGLPGASDVELVNSLSKETAAGGSKEGNSPGQSSLPNGEEDSSDESGSPKLAISKSAPRAVRPR